MTCKFSIDASNLGHGNLEIDITCNGQYVPHQVRPLGNRKFEVSFMPKILSIHYANVKLNGIFINGSPFPIKINKPNYLFSVCGEGLGYVPIRQSTSFRIDTDSTDGNTNCMEVFVRITDPNSKQLPVQIYSEKAGTSQIEYKPEVVGKHKIDIHYMNEPIPGNPYFANVYDLSKINILCMPKQFIKDTENSFKIDMQNAGDIKLVLRITTPSKGLLPNHVDGDRVRLVRFVPNELGPHRLSILFNGRDIHGSPVNIFCVDSNKSSTPIPVCKEWLHGIDTTENAKELETDRNDAHSVAIFSNQTQVVQLKHVDDRDFPFQLEPIENVANVLETKKDINHQVSLKKCVIDKVICEKGNHVERPEHLVKVSGPGITNGVLSRFESSFTCDTNDTRSPGDLCVRVRGPKGAFQVEMKRESQESKIITCKYHPNEAGDYLISVKWCGKDAKGSPFAVKIFKNQSELTRFLNSNSDI